jgi:hypothetical protein
MEFLAKYKHYLLLKTAMGTITYDEGERAFFVLVFVQLNST